MQHSFEKRIFSAGRLLRDVGWLAFHFPRLLVAQFSGRRDGAISRAFRERIMTVVTAVNGCTYCAWYHARKAVESGMTDCEVANLLRLQFQADAPHDELPALLFAQHYAETDRRPDPTMVHQFFAAYGEPTARRILFVIRVILFANLAGNTFDAFLSRRQGRPARNSNPVFEFFFFALSAPILWPAHKRMRGASLPTVLS